MTWMLASSVPLTCTGTAKVDDTSALTPFSWGQLGNIPLGWLELDANGLIPAYLLPPLDGSLLPGATTTSQASSRSPLMQRHWRARSRSCAGADAPELPEEHRQWPGGAGCKRPGDSWCAACCNADLTSVLGGIRPMLRRWPTAEYCWDQPCEHRLPARAAWWAGGARQHGQAAGWSVADHSAGVIAAGASGMDC